MISSSSGIRNEKEKSNWKKGCYNSKDEIEKNDENYDLKWNIKGTCKVFSYFFIIHYFPVSYILQCISS